MLLADNDPLSLRAPIVGVWISGGGTAASGQHQRQHQKQQQHSVRRPSPLSHPHAYPACLRFLLGFRGGGGGGGGGRATKPTAAAASASPSAFLLLQLPGGIGGGTPTCFEACALHAGGAAARTAATATAAASADGSGLLSVSFVGFEQLDFSADVDVVLGGMSEKDKEGGRRRGGGGGGDGSGKGGTNRAVVIGRLRRVSNLSAAGGAFGRALARERGRCEEDTPELVCLWLFWSCLL